jgi:hypothetical protein
MFLKLEKFDIENFPDLFDKENKIIIQKSILNTWDYT